MTATNMYSNFSSKWYSPPVQLKYMVMARGDTIEDMEYDQDKMWCHWLLQWWDITSIPFTERKAFSARKSQSICQNWYLLFQQDSKQIELAKW